MGQSVRVSGNKEGELGNKLTEQGDVVPVLRVDDPHRRLVQAQLPCVSLKRARDGAVRRVWEVDKALKTVRRDYTDETTRLTRGRDCISICINGGEKGHLGVPGGRSGPRAHF